MIMREAQFRFGVNMTAPANRAVWTDKCRKAEDLGYDVVAVPDHLGMPAPFPALVLAAEATEQVRLCSFVLNTCFYNPALLARDVAGTDQLTDGRLDIGLGTGYVRDEFDAAGIPFPTPGQRLDHLEHTLDELGRLFAEPEHEPKPAQSAVPLVLGGRGDRMLRLAAERANVVGFTGAAPAERDGGALRLADADSIAERVAFVLDAAGDRRDDVELNVLVQWAAVGYEPHRAVETLRPNMPDLGVDQLAALPTLLAGSPEEIAERIVAHRERFGFSYFTVLEHNLEDFAPVIEKLR